MQEEFWDFSSRVISNDTKTAQVFTLAGLCDQTVGCDIELAPNETVRVQLRPHQ